MNLQLLPTDERPDFIARYRRTCPRTGKTISTVALVFLPPGAQSEAERVLAPFISAGLVERLERGTA